MYVKELSDLTNTDPGMVQSMLNSSALSPGHTCSCPAPAMMSASNMMYPSYTMESSNAADISLTTSSPVEQSGDSSSSSTVTHTTLPPVQLPGPKPGTTDTAAQAEIVNSEKSH